MEAVKRELEDKFLAEIQQVREHQSSEMEASKGKLEKILAKVLQLNGLMKVAKGELNLQQFRKNLKKGIKRA